MKHKPFRFPARNVTLVRRHAAEEFMLMAEAYAKLLLSGGRSAFRGTCYPNRGSYHTAVSRLRKSGLLVAPQPRGATPHLRLTAAGKDRIHELKYPDRLWKRKWNGIWYLLSYDIPETDRSYRHVLRKFLRRLRFGCLHHSLWITPDDRRPEFQDLSRGAGAGGFAFMFAAEVVQDTPHHVLVHQAWDWDALQEIQLAYCQYGQENLERLQRSEMPIQALAALAREEMQAYMYAMDSDPLLPAPLLPTFHLGPKVARIHRGLVKAIRRAAS